MYNRQVFLCDVSIVLVAGGVSGWELCIIDRCFVWCQQCPGGRWCVRLGVMYNQWVFLCDVSNVLVAGDVSGWVLCIIDRCFVWCQQCPGGSRCVRFGAMYICQVFCVVSTVCWWW